MPEAFVRTIKRDYVRVSPRPNAEAGSHATTKFTRTRLSVIRVRCSGLQQVPESA